MTLPKLPTSTDISKDSWLQGHCVKSGRVGASFDSELSLPSGFVIEREEGLAVLDLALDRNARRVMGTPNKSGEFDILLHGILEPSGKRSTVVLTLNINPDPTTLWKDIPSDQNGVYARPDTYHDFLVSTDEMALFTASRRGRRHAHKGDYRDDASSIRYCDKTGWHVACVADGAGSATFSREGARIAANTMTQMLPDALSQLDSTAFNEKNPALCQCMVDAAKEAARLIEEQAMWQEKAVADYSTTVIVAAVRKVGAEWLCVSFSVGDGGCTIWDAEKSTLIPMSLADSGEFAGETRFLDSRILADTDQCMNRLFVCKVPMFTGFFLMTDGVSDPWFETEYAMQDASNWTEFWHGQLAPLFLGEQAECSNRILKWLEFFVTGEHDDRTIAAFIPGTSQSTDEKAPEVAQTCNP
ncbi:MAG: PP2C family serine/threonine-protein phosphatase [Granulosicoccus sp.]